MNEVEAVARAIAPSRWEVMDHYLAQTKRKYDGENAAYDPDQFKDRESMVTAQAAIAALDAARGDAEPVAWMPIETAPKDGTAFQAIIPGHGADNVLCWTDGLIGSDGRDCGSWVFASDQEPPDCWTDGYCWEVNEDGVPSVQPTHWKPLLPPRGDQVARVAAWQPIETAPFDQMILLHCPHTVPKVSVGCCAEDCGWLIVEYDMMGSNCRPTHWTPLPKGPTDGPA